METIKNEECFIILMRLLNDIAIKMTKKESLELLYIISQLESLQYFPSDIRLKKDYKDLYGMD